MSADVIDFRTRQHAAHPQVTDGDSARAALIGIARALPIDVGLQLAELWADTMLRELWVRGFIIAPASDRVIR